MRFKSIAIAAALLLTQAVGVSLQAADFVGTNQVPVPANSDALVTVPFVQSSVGSFTVNGKSGGNILTVAGAPFTIDAYKDLYYIRITKGAARGRWSTISGNTTSTLTMADSSFFADLAVNDTFDIVPHQTLAKVFTDNLNGISFVESTSTLTHSMDVLTPSTADGINKSAGATYYFYDRAWRKGLPSAGNFSNTVLPPDAYFIIRNRTTTALSFITQGHAISAAHQAKVLKSTVGQKNDVSTTSGSLLPITVNELYLGGSSAFTTSTGTLVRKDELQVYLNGVTGLNRSADAIYYFYQGAWRRTSEGNTPPDRGGDVLPAGAALIVRKASDVAPTNYVWTQPN